MEPGRVYRAIHFCLNLSFVCLPSESSTHSKRRKTYTNALVLLKSHTQGREQGLIFQTKRMGLLRYRTCLQGNKRQGDRVTQAAPESPCFSASSFLRTQGTLTQTRIKKVLKNLNSLKTSKPYAEDFLHVRLRLCAFILEFCRKMPQLFAIQPPFPNSEILFAVSLTNGYPASSRMFLLTGSSLQSFRC